MASRSTIIDRLAGKWQVPLLLLSLASLGVALFATLPTVETLPAQEATAYLDTLMAADRFDDAAQFALKALHDPDKTEAQRAALHLRLGRARFQLAGMEGAHTPPVGAMIEEDFVSAMAHGVELTAVDYEQLGRLREWQHKQPQAVEVYEEAIRLGFAAKDALRKRVFELRRTHLKDTPEELGAQLDAILAEADHAETDLRLWAIEERLYLLEDAGALDQAPALLMRHRDEFERPAGRPVPHKDTPPAHRFDYLEALVMYKTGDIDGAERFLRALRNGLSRADEADRMTAWLLGRVMLDADRPEEAMTFFKDVRTHHPDSSHALASVIGLGEALAHLERHDEALAAYRRAVGELQAAGESRLVNRGLLRASLLVQVDRLRREQKLDGAIGYGELALELVDRGDVGLATGVLQQVGDVLDTRVKRLRDESAPETRKRGNVETRKCARRAAEIFLEIARINTLTDDRAAEAHWRAADLYEQAGRPRTAARLFGQYVTERPGDPVVPRALTRLAALHRRLGEFDRAIAVYGECHERFGRTLDGARALLPLAECYRAAGRLPEAEQTLSRVLNDPEVFTPRAPEFAEAMYQLGDILNQTGQYERSISLLEEWTTRYAEAAGGAGHRLRVQYLLADSYRNGGLALRAEADGASFSGEREQMLAEVRERLARARRLYRELIESARAREGEGLSALERVYLRQAQFYEADCVYEMGLYREALKLYEEAAGTYQDAPAALAAFVQIVSCHLYLGSPHEGRAALARAEILVDRVPDAALARGVSPETRDDWKRFFKWLGQSELLASAE